MRTSTLTLGGLLSAGALAAATVVGGAGIAGAQSGVLSSASLGSSTSAEEAPALALTIDDATPEGVKGALENLTDEEATNCSIAISHADVAKKYEAYVADNNELPASGSSLDDELQAANELHQNWIALPGTIDASDTADWEGAQGAVTATEDYPAGAWASCDIDGEKVFAFAYEAQPDGFFGSVQGLIGSLDIGGSLT